MRELAYILENVELLDGGTGGFVLLSLFHDYNIIVIIDAALSNAPPGTINVVQPKFAKDFPKSLRSILSHAPFIRSRQ